MFTYALPVPAAASGSHDAPRKPDGGKPGEGGGPRKDERDAPRPPRDPGQIQTQMVGEKPGDDLGYDPRIIPTEKIPD